MYLHLEQNILIPKGKVLGIFDIDTMASSKISLGFLQKAQVQGEVIDIWEEFPRSYVVVEEDFGNLTLYVSGKSSRSLKRRYDVVGEEAWK